MARMVRKQLYLDVETERKLKRLASSWKCSEAAVVRKAVENVPERPKTRDEEQLDRLEAAGLITRPKGPPPSDQEEEAVERELDELWAGQDVPDLAQYVIEEREGR